MSNSSGQVHEYVANWHAAMSERSAVQCRTAFRLSGPSAAGHKTISVTQSMAWVKVGGFTFSLLLKSVLLSKQRAEYAPYSTLLWFGRHSLWTLRCTRSLPWSASVCSSSHWIPICQLDPFTECCFIDVNAVNCGSPVWSDGYGVVGGRVHLSLRLQFQLTKWDAHPARTIKKRRTTAWHSTDWVSDCWEWPDD